MSEITRREALSQLAFAIAAAAAIDATLVAESHTAVQQAAAASGGTYAPRALTTAQFRTLERLTDLIIPVEDGRPGATKADVPAWIDTLLNVNAELKARYVTGLTWLDTTMQSRSSSDFVRATPAQQIALLDQIAFPANRTPELSAGIDFFTLARRMTVDGFYTSPLGMRDIYPGNTPRNSFPVPQEAIDYVLSRSPFK
jgi:gluconate 2-dehydrogenase gamma chain